MRNRVVLSEIMVLLLLLISCTPDQTPTGVNNDPPDEIIELDREIFLGNWAGSYSCGLPSDTMVILAGSGELDVRVGLHTSHSLIDTVYGELVSHDSIVIPEQTIGNAPGFAEITYSAENGLTLSQHGFGITCTGHYTSHFKQPVISSFIADQRLITTNHSINIVCNATTPDDDSLTYSWITTGGTITGTGNEVSFTAPDTMGIVSVTCTVGNGTGGEAGAEVTLSITIASLSTMSDIDGNIYQTVIIGDQEWMAENLKVTRYRNGVPLTREGLSGDGNINTGKYTIYHNDTAAVKVYGLLYDGFAAVDSQNIAPEGWHVPSDDEWKELEMLHGMSQSQADTLSDRGTNEGSKIKEAGTKHWGWGYPIEMATNETGFTALPAGYRYTSGSFGWIQRRYDGRFWTNTITIYGTVYARGLEHDKTTIFRGHWPEHYAFSIRCIKD